MSIPNNWGDWRPNLTPHTGDLQATDLIECTMIVGGLPVNTAITGQQIIDAASGGGLTTADRMVIVGRNSTGVTLYAGTVIYISGSTGNRPNYVKAQANTEATSAGTFGVIVADIANNSDGNALIIGTLDNLDTRAIATHPFTTDTLVDGDTLYLDPTTAGYVTRVKPSAPNHIVYIGKVVRTSPTNGTIVYRIQNGYELDEIHDVAIASVANNDVLQYDSATSLWKNRAISSGLTVGTTAIASGTIGGILFQNGSNLLGQDAALFWDNTNKRLGVGATPSTSVRLDVRAQGPAATDIGIRVRNSSDTTDLFQVNGVGDTTSIRYLFGDAILLSGGTNVARYAGTALIKHRFTNNGTTAYFEIDPANSIIYSDSSMKMSIGASTAGAKLDVRAQGALSTDLAFRVRNSANTLNAFKVQGDNEVNVRANLSLGLYAAGATRKLYMVRDAETYGLDLDWSGASTIGARIVNNGSGALNALIVSCINGYENNAIAIANGDISITSAVGTKIGITTTQKLSFWNKTPIVQPTTAIAAATFVANTSLIANDTATFDGYTIGQIVKALRNTGILA
tara:strand:- start:1365 stop:3071 length:1707 start_codon:yes stop_codon:yes gene_type:complete